MSNATYQGHVLLRTSCVFRTFDSVLLYDVDYKCVTPESVSGDSNFREEYAWY